MQGILVRDTCVFLRSFMEINGRREDDGRIFDALQVSWFTPFASTLRGELVIDHSSEMYQTPLNQRD
jgi:hypothetical protein